MSAERPGWFGELLTIVIADAAVVTLAALTVLAFWSRRVILLPIALIAHAGLDLFHHSLSMGFTPPGASRPACQWMPCSPWAPTLRCGEI